MGICSGRSLVRPSHYLGINSDPGFNSNMTQVFSILEINDQIINRQLMFPNSFFSLSMYNFLLNLR